MTLSPKLYFFSVQTALLLGCFFCAVFIGRAVPLTVLFFFLSWKVYRHWFLPQQFRDRFSGGPCLKNPLRQIYNSLETSGQDNTTQLYNLTTPWLTSLAGPDLAGELLIHPDLGRKLSNEEVKGLYQIYHRQKECDLPKYGLSFYGLATPFRPLRSLVNWIFPPLSYPQLHRLLDRLSYGMIRMTCFPVIALQEKIYFEMASEDSPPREVIASLLSNLVHLRKSHGESAPALSLCLLEPHSALCQWRQRAHTPTQNSVHTMDRKGIFL